MRTRVLFGDLVFGGAAMLNGRADTPLLKQVGCIRVGLTLMPRDEDNNTPPCLENMFLARLISPHNSAKMDIGSSSC